jgi:hypothetical protein
VLRDSWWRDNIDFQYASPTKFHYEPRIKTLPITSTLSLSLSQSRAWQMENNKNNNNSCRRWRRAPNIPPSHCLFCKKFPTSSAKMPPQRVPREYTQDRKPRSASLRGCHQGGKRHRMVLIAHTRTRSRVFAQRQLRLPVL